MVLGVLAARGVVGVHRVQDVSPLWRTRRSCRHEWIMLSLFPCPWFVASEKWLSMFRQAMRLDDVGEEKQAYR